LLRVRQRRAEFEERGYHSTVAKDARALKLGRDEFTGHQLGKYEVLCRLSMGGMAEIFLALQRGVAGFRKLVVLKQVLPDLAQDPDFVRRFLEEAKVMAAFSHTNIAQVHDLDRVDNEYFLAMEFVPGASLLELLRVSAQENELLPINFSLTVASAVGRALHYAHTFRDEGSTPRPVIHRDIAPKNIMVTYDGTPKLLDFGAAKSMGFRTAVGKLIGTPSYMSPEQTRGLPLDGTSDVFALGVVLHECLTGTRLFVGSTLIEQIAAVQNQEIPPPSRLNPMVPAAVDAVVLKALARDKEHRFTTALDFARAVEDSTARQLWTPEEMAAVVERFFSSRRLQTGLLVQGLRDGAEATAILSSPLIEVSDPTVADRPEPSPSLPPPLRLPPLLPSPEGAPAPRATTETALAAPAFNKRAPWPLLIVAGVVGLGLIGVALYSALAHRHDGQTPLAAEPVAQTSPATLGPSAAIAPSKTPPPVEISPPGPAPTVDSPPETSSPRPPRSEPGHAIRTDRAPSRRPAPKVAAENGTLWIRVRPWALVYLDGVFRGETPLDPFPVTAGTHTVTLANDSIHVRKKYEVEIRAHEQHDLKVSLEEP
jgi:eukaryotic-like serine/threonine-protein kinase